MSEICWIQILECVCVYLNRATIWPSRPVEIKLWQFLDISHKLTELKKGIGRSTVETTYGQTYLNILMVASVQFSDIPYNGGQELDRRNTHHQSISTYAQLFLCASELTRNKASRSSFRGRGCSEFRVDCKWRSLFSASFQYNIISGLHPESYRTAGGLLHVLDVKWSWFWVPPKKFPNLIWCVCFDGEERCIWLILKS